MSAPNEGCDSDGRDGILPTVPTMTITVDTRTGLPSFKCTELPLAFWQMMVGEVVRQLDEQRRAAVARALQQQHEQLRSDAAVLKMVQRNPSRLP